MPPPSLIALVGPAGSGKTTVARHLEQRYGYRRVPFAAPLKNMLRALGLGDRELDGDLKAEPCEAVDYVTPRHAMQTLGTEWGRKLISPTLWTNAWLRSIAGETGPIVADDLRFVNEELTVRLFAGQVWRIDRPGFDAGKHLSEQEYRLVRADASLLNGGLPGDLFDDVDRLLAKVPA